MKTDLLTSLVRFTTLVLIAWQFAPGSFAFSQQPALLQHDQPQWGERWTRNMVSPVTGLPDNFTPGERDKESGLIDPATTRNVRWVAELGNKTYGTPVIADGKVYIGTNNETPRNPAVEGDRGVLICFDEMSGEFLWQLLVPKRDELRFFDSPRTGISTTPTVDNGYIYVTTNRCEVVCLDPNGLADGNNGPFLDEVEFMTDPDDETPHVLATTDADIIWCYNMVDQAGVRSHDAANSAPLIHDGLLYVGTSNGLDEAHEQVKEPDAPAMIVLDAATGQLVARDDGWVGPNVVHGQWSSPVMGMVDGKPLIIYGGGDGRLFGFRPLAKSDVTIADSIDTASRIKPLWTFDGQPERQVGQSHTFQPGRGSESYTCVATPVLFEDRIYMVFSHDPWMGKKTARVVCLEVTGQGDVTTTAQRWSHQLERESLASASIDAGSRLMFLTDNGGFLYCFDIDTGELCWKQELGGNIWGSTLLVDGKLIVGTSRRALWVIDPVREFKAISEIEMNDQIYNSASAANRTLFIATHRNLYAVEKRATNR